MDRREGKTFREMDHLKQAQLLPSAPAVAGSQTRSCGPDLRLGNATILSLAAKDSGHRKMTALSFRMTAV